MAHMDSPSAQRNKDPIWGELKKLVPQLKLLSSSPTGDKNDDPNDNNFDTPLQVLEIAAGVGVHTLHFVSKMTSELNQNVYWYPSDPDETSRNSILARVQSCKTSKIQESIYTPPLALTLGTDGILEEVDGVHDYSQIIVEGNIDLITCINMIHISPWEATIGLFKLASNKLKCGGILYCYGPYKVNGSAVESNLRFDASLKSRDSSWGVRDLESVIALANENGMTLEEKIEMPANNLSLIFRKTI